MADQFWAKECLSCLPAPDRPVDAPKWSQHALFTVGVYNTLDTIICFGFDSSSAFPILIIEFSRKNVTEKSNV